MILIKTDRFNEELQLILDFISLDSPLSALNFFDDLLLKINQIPQNPYINRKRLTKNDENIRELIFKGYTVPYFLDQNMIQL